MKAVASTQLERRVDGQRNCEYRPRKKTDQDRQRIKQDRSAVMFHGSRGAPEVVLQEKTPQKLAIRRQTYGPIPRQGNRRGGKDRRPGPHRPARLQEVKWREWSSNTRGKMARGPRLCFAVATWQPDDKQEHANDGRGKNESHRTLCQHSESHCGVHGEHFWPMLREIATGNDQFGNRIQRRRLKARSKSPADVDRQRQSRAKDQQ